MAFPATADTSRRFCATSALVATEASLICKRASLKRCQGQQEAAVPWRAPSTAAPTAGSRRGESYANLRAAECPLCLPQSRGAEIVPSVIRVQKLRDSDLRSSGLVSLILEASRSFDPKG